MQFDSFYSSSSGNLYVVTATTGERLLIECGVPWRKILPCIEYNLGDVRACLISHAHL